MEAVPGQQQQVESVQTPVGFFSQRLPNQEYANQQRRRQKEKTRREGAIEALRQEEKCVANKNEPEQNPPCHQAI